MHDGFSSDGSFGDILKDDTSVQYENTVTLEVCEADKSTLRRDAAVASRGSWNLPSHFVKIESG